MNQELWNEEEKIREILGVEELLDSLEMAIGGDMLEDMLAYICRMNDIKTTLKEKRPRLNMHILYLELYFSLFRYLIIFLVLLDLIYYDMSFEEYLSFFFSTYHISIHFQSLDGS